MGMEDLGGRGVRMWSCLACPHVWVLPPPPNTHTQTDMLKLLKLECPKRPTMCAVFHHVSSTDYFDVHLLGGKPPLTE